MKFLWPQLLWLLLVLPALVAFYIWILRWRKVSLDYAQLGLVRQALGRGGNWRRHVPPLLFLLALACLIVAIARPQAAVPLPADQQTVMLVMDVSGSMRAQDVAPDRITASQTAAKRFVGDLPAGIRVGVVSFAGSAALVQPPTQSRDEVNEAIDRFQLQRGTAIGSGLAVALATLFPEEKIDVSNLTEGGLDDRGLALGAAPPKPGNGTRSPPVAPGSYSSAAIILLTDGQRTHGPDPVDVARIIGQHGVRVYSVGFGTTEGQVTTFEGWSMRVRLDEDTLKTVAGLTQGEYFHATSAVDLKQVYETLRSRIAIVTRETEVSALFAAVGALLALLAATLSLWWFGRTM